MKKNDRGVSELNSLTEIVLPLEPRKRILKKINAA